MNWSDRMMDALRMLRRSSGTADRAWRLQLALEYMLEVRIRGKPRDWRIYGKWERRDG